MTAGEHLLSLTYLRNFHGLPPSYKGPEPSSRPPEALISTRGQLTEKDIETIRKYGTKIKTDAVETRIDNRFESIDIGGPFDQVTAAPPESLRRIYVCGHAAGKHAGSCARTILTSFAGRAFRRPATPKEIDDLLGYVALVRKQGDSFEEGIATALQAALVSPGFLYRIERDQPASGGRSSLPVSQYELASRLSYFLWSERFPMFDESLRQAMRRETELFFDNIFRNSGNILELLDAGYTFVNERLARFYGIPGPEFRRVNMTETDRGGGILAHCERAVCHPVHGT